MKYGILGLALLAASPALAQSSLGITGAEVSFGATQDEAGTPQPEVRTILDVAITSAHGLQGDLSFADTENGVIGNLGAHLYMQPRPGQKYGLFATLSDVDGRSMLWASIGAEGIIALSDTTSMEGRVGLGAADAEGLDFIFAGIAVAHDLSPSLQIEASLNVADFDEAAFRATAYDVGLTARYSPEGAPWGTYASLTHSGLTGRDGASGETRLGLGVTINFGQMGGSAPATRPFRMNDPVAALARRGLW